MADNILTLGSQIVTIIFFNTRKLHKTINCEKNDDKPHKTRKMKYINLNKPKAGFEYWISLWYHIEDFDDSTIYNGGVFYDKDRKKSSNHW
jgi:hypothetical protein